MSRAANMAPPDDLTGRVFTYLTVVSYAGRTGTENRWSWNCVCRCGNHVIVLHKRLMCGATKSCGCLQPEVAKKIVTKHDACNTREYRAWGAMKTRCLNSNINGWHYYGGRGITICERWINSFENFLADMGICPPGLTLDRIDVNGNYEPSNCRWATWELQRTNKRIATHCKRGHLFTEKSSYFDTFGRHCRICRNEAERRRYIRNKYA